MMTGLHACMHAELPGLPARPGGLPGRLSAGRAGEQRAAPVPEADPARLHAAPVAPPAPAVLQQPLLLLGLRAGRCAPWVPP